MIDPPICNYMETGPKAVHCGQLHACFACSIHRCPIAGCAQLRSTVLLTTADNSAAFTCRPGPTIPHVAEQQVNAKHGARKDEVLPSVGFLAD